MHAEDKLPIYYISIQNAANRAEDRWNAGIRTIMESAGHLLLSPAAHIMMMAKEGLLHLGAEAGLGFQPRERALVLTLT